MARRSAITVPTKPCSTVSTFLDRTVREKKEVKEIY